MPSTWRGYLLPLATNTSLGQIVNARTLETQISRLLTSDFAEIRQLGEKLKRAASEPAWNVQHEAAQTLMEELEAASGTRDARVQQMILRDVKAAPTLVKYAVPNEYQKESARLLTQAASELMAGTAIADAPGRRPWSRATMRSRSSWRRRCCIRTATIRTGSCARLSPGWAATGIAEIVAMGVQHRGRHDELLRAFHVGAKLKFDILMDIGGFRDMHRHRRCTQLLQGFTDLHGYETPDAPGQPTLAESGLTSTYAEAMDAGPGGISHGA